ncbi:TlpA family protein disulfide reductase [Nocardioides anomalus]|uniref:TlpA family protein disulfide reductase n=1 Tax=Nocardioides anomalus TaxID=2712223 RepID=A0A6G6WHM7_9ACTN|nr:TlpA disulfide reductase family protein [Nocardioides anomalus]QIG44744.1 TlpA family protein disulfide reductase [Nocardioides anomalus]
MPVRRLAALAAVLTLTVGAATACTEANGTEGKDYVAGDSIVVPIPVAQRKSPVEFSGETLSGDRLDLADLRGKPVVVNVWWSECPPCRKEAPILQEASGELADGASVVGINIRDTSKDNALAFERTFDVTYPSIYDFGSQQLLNFPPPYNPRDMPSTMVLDDQGRVAALIRGEIPSKTTLLELVEDVAAGK